MLTDKSRDFDGKRILVVAFNPLARFPDMEKKLAGFGFASILTVPDILAGYLAAQEQDFDFIIAPTLELAAILSMEGRKPIAVAATNPDYADPDDTNVISASLKGAKLKEKLRAAPIPSYKETLGVLPVKNKHDQWHLTKVGHINYIEAIKSGVKVVEDNSEFEAPFSVDALAPLLDDSYYCRVNSKQIVGASGLHELLYGPLGPHKVLIPLGRSNKKAFDIDLLYRTQALSILQRAKDNLNCD